MFLVTGVLAALVERTKSGRGQVVDAAMVDGTAALMAMTYGFLAAGAWREERGSNVLDGGAPFYGTYECADGRWVAVGAIEAPFYAALLVGLGSVAPDVVATLPAQLDQAQWLMTRKRFQAVFRMRDRDQWLAIFDGTDACVTPVLTLTEAAQHEHLLSRRTFVPGPAGWVQPAPAPRFSRTVPEAPSPASAAGADTNEGLRNWGVDEHLIQELLAAGAILQA
jgi:alpha-methylacyl-CoA racemase